MSGSGVVGLADIQHEIEQGMRAIGLAAKPAMLVQFTDFVTLLIKWNQTYNLTAIADPGSIVRTHLLDSLVVAAHLVGNRGIDVGSGAGFPGIPLAIAIPETRITLLDSNQKKTAFLRQAVAALKLSNADVVCARAESWVPDRRYDWVVSRAFADLAVFAASAAHLAAPSGVLAAMKGAYPEKEIAALPPAHQVREVIRLEVPGLHAQRHLVLIGQR